MLACRRSQEEAEEGYQEAEAALEIMEEAEAEEAELEEVEDLLEYYLQRATTTQSEAERLLAGSRDLEESIGVSLSARRFEVSTDLFAGMYLPLYMVQCVLAVSHVSAYKCLRHHAQAGHIYRHMCSQCAARLCPCICLACQLNALL